MVADITPDRARAARAAVSVLFFAHGALFASLLPRLPAIKETLSLSNAELGLAVAAGPIGGLLMGAFAGLLIARFGSGRVASLAGVATSGLLLGVALAGTWAWLALAFFLMGMFDATMDAAMNAHGIGVQRQYGRSILQGFHGVWSVGSLLAGGAGAVAAALAVPVGIHLAAASIGMAIVIVLTARWMLPATVADLHPADEAALEPVTLRTAPRLLRVLVPIAMLGILCVILQGAAATWSAVYLTDVLLQPQGIAAVAYVLYMAAMVVGRMTNDRWVDRWGERQVVRVGALVAGVGVAAVMVSGPLAQPLLAFAGFALVG